MGWFSKFLSYIGGAIASPFTAGSSMVWALAAGAGLDAATSIYGAKKAVPHTNVCTVWGSGRLARQW